MMLGALDLPRSVSYTEEDLISYGKDYNHSLPSMRVSTDGDAVNLNAEWQQGTGLTGAAYCIFSFNAAGYDREDLVQYQWQVEPKDHEEFYVGLSNWDRDAWV